MIGTAELTTAQKLGSVETWYSSATVRNRPRIVVPMSDRGEYIFPRSRQLISEHPLVVARGPEAVAFVLAQSAYKYMYEIGMLETRFVIDCALKIVNNQIAGANDDEKRDALTIVIDEGYHAYVALDFIIQMRALCGVSPISVPESNGNLDAVRRAYERLPSHVHNDFQLISVCLAEHTLTKDLLSIGKEKEATRTFTQVMADHVADEGRHANYFAKMMKAHWGRIPEPSRVLIGSMLPEYLDDYLAGDIERRHDRHVLGACELRDEEIGTVIADTHDAYLSIMNEYILKTKGNLIRLLQRTDVLSHGPTRSSFEKYGIPL